MIATGVWVLVGLVAIAVTGWPGAMLAGAILVAVWKLQKPPRK